MRLPLPRLIYMDLRHLMLRLHSEGGEKDSIWQAFKKYIIIEIKQTEKHMYAQQYFRPQEEKLDYLCLQKST